MMKIPESRKLQTKEEISGFVNMTSFRCLVPFLSWLEFGTIYWFEYMGDSIYKVKSENNKGQIFEMDVFQLLTSFYPDQCESDQMFALKYGHWLGEQGIPHEYIDNYTEKMNDILLI